MSANKPSILHQSVAVSGNSLRTADGILEDYVAARVSPNDISIREGLDAKRIDAYSGFAHIPSLVLSNMSGPDLRLSDGNHGAQFLKNQGIDKALILIPKSRWDSLTQTDRAKLSPLSREAFDVVYEASNAYYEPLLKARKTLRDRADARREETFTATGKGAGASLFPTQEAAKAIHIFDDKVIVEKRDGTTQEYDSETQLLTSRTPYAMAYLYQSVNGQKCEVFKYSKSIGNQQAADGDAIDNQHFKRFIEALHSSSVEDKTIPTRVSDADVLAVDIAMVARRVITESLEALIAEYREQNSDIFRPEKHIGPDVKDEAITALLPDDINGILALAAGILVGENLAIHNPFTDGDTLEERISDDIWSELTNNNGYQSRLETALRNEIPTLLEKYRVSPSAAGHVAAERFASMVGNTSINGIVERVFDNNLNQFQTMLGLTPEQTMAYAFLSYGSDLHVFINKVAGTDVATFMRTHGLDRVSTFTNMRYSELLEALYPGTHGLEAIEHYVEEVHGGSYNKFLIDGFRADAAITHSIAAEFDLSMDELVGFTISTISLLPHFPAGAALSLLWGNEAEIFLSAAGIDSLESLKDFVGKVWKDPSTEDLKKLVAGMFGSQNLYERSLQHLHLTLSKPEDWDFALLLNDGSVVTLVGHSGGGVMGFLDTHGLDLETFAGRAYSTIALPQEKLARMLSDFPSLVEHYSNLPDDGARTAFVEKLDADLGLTPGDAANALGTAATHAEEIKQQAEKAAAQKLHEKAAADTYAIRATNIIRPLTTLLGIEADIRVEAREGSDPNDPAPSIIIRARTGNLNALHTPLNNELDEDFGQHIALSDDGTELRIYIRNPTRPGALANEPRVFRALQKAFDDARIRQAEAALEPLLAMPDIPPSHSRPRPLPFPGWGRGQ